MRYFNIVKDFIYNIIYTIFSFLGIDLGEVAMQSGELIVTGEDKVEIVLRGEPAQVAVKFKDTCVIVPCNPQHYDDLEYEVVKHHHKHHYTLVIRWNVSGVREIVWTVCY